jgi:hypothetical protein
VAVIPGGPDWASIMTAFGTVGAVVAALGIAVWSERRTDTRLTAERAHSDQQLREERDRADARVQAERDTARAREQLAEAYAVQVSVAAIRREVSRLDNSWVDAGDWQEAPAAVLVNGGQYTITGIDTRFCYPESGQVAGHRTAQRVSSMARLPAPLAGDLSPLTTDLDASVLTPADVGVRFYGEFAEPGVRLRVYPVARWTDQWGTRWEHRRGQVRPVQDGEPWRP